MSLQNPLDKSFPKQSRTGVWASIISAIMPIGNGIFWVAHPAAVEGSFTITPDSDAAIRFSKISTIFKGVGDLLPSIFLLLTLGYRQFVIPIVMAAFCFLKPNPKTS